MTEQYRLIKWDLLYALTPISTLDEKKNRYKMVKFIYSMAEGFNLTNTEVQMFRKYCRDYHEYFKIKNIS